MSLCTGWWRCETGHAGPSSYLHLQEYFPDSWVGSFPLPILCGGYFPWGQSAVIYSCLSFSLSLHYKLVTMQLLIDCAWLACLIYLNYITTPTVFGHPVWCDWMCAKCQVPWPVGAQHRHGNVPVLPGFVRRWEQPQVPAGSQQLCEVHGSVFPGWLPATDQGQTQWQHYAWHWWSHYPHW